MTWDNLNEDLFDLFYQSQIYLVEAALERRVSDCRAYARRHVAFERMRLSRVRVEQHQAHEQRLIVLVSWYMHQLELEALRETQKKIFWRAWNRQHNKDQKKRYSIVSRKTTEPFKLKDARRRSQLSADKRTSNQRSAD